MIRMVVESASDLELHRKVAALYAHYNATVYRSLAEGEEKIYAFTLLFPDETALETFLAEAPNGPADELLRHATIDCYIQSSYALIDGVWTPTDAIQDSRIMWPGHSPNSHRNCLRKPPCNVRDDERRNQPNSGRTWMPAIRLVRGRRPPRRSSSFGAVGQPSNLRRSLVWPHENL